MHQAVDVARQADEDAEVGDGLDLAGHLVAAVVVLGELLPRVGLALLQAQRNTAALLVHVEHHDLDFLAGVHHLRGVDVLVGPVHLRDVHQAFDAVLDLHERAVVGDVGDLAEHAGVRRIAAGNVLPRIRAELLQAEADTRALAIELQDAHIDLVADLDDFGRMLDALPRHVGDVQQAVDAAQVDERTVVGEVLDRAAHDRAFLQVVHQRAALGGELLLDDRTPRDHDVIALLIELDDLELERLVLEIRRIAHRTHIDERARQECADVVDLDGEAALDAAGDDAGDDLGVVECLFQARPGAGALGLLARQTGLARAVLDGIQCNFDLSPGLTSTSPRSFLNCSRGMTASDLRPTLTMTTSGVTSTTSPVRIIPGRIRWLARLCSKSSAKLSVIPSLARPLTGRACTGPCIRLRPRQM